jgi:hypothetical protein
MGNRGANDRDAPRLGYAAGTEPRINGRFINDPVLANSPYHHARYLYCRESWECEGAYDGQFRAQAYAKAYLSDGAVIRLPQGGGYATSRQAGIDC